MAARPSIYNEHIIAVNLPIHSVYSQLTARFLKNAVSAACVTLSRYKPNLLVIIQLNRKKTISTKEMLVMSVITVTKDNFQKEVIDSSVPVLMDFWASWCGPCKMLSPVIDEISEETAGIKVCKVNVDEQPELAGQFGVMSIPTLVVMKNGKIANKSMGAQPKTSVLALLNV